MARRKSSDLVELTETSESQTPIIVDVFLTIDAKNSGLKSYTIYESAFSAEDRARLASGDIEVETSLGNYKLVRDQYIQNNHDLTSPKKILTYASAESRIKF